MATETYLLSVQGVVGSSYNECVLAFTSNGTSPTDTLDYAKDCANAFLTHGLGTWLDLFPSTYELRMVSALRAFPKPSASAYSQFSPGAAPGTRGSDATSLNLCPSVFLVPPMGIKSGGRVFLPAIGQGEIANSAYTGGYVTAVDAFFGAAVSGFAGSGTNWQLAIFSRKNVSASLVQSWVLSPRIGFQSRRRKPTGAV